MKKFTYDTRNYNFKEIIEKHFGVDELSLVHVSRSELLPSQKLDFFTETRTKFHKTFYSKLNNGWPELVSSYEKFIKDEIVTLFRDRIVYQAFPSIRFHLPNDKAIHYWHYDSDKEHMHPDWEINFQLALTDMYDTQATWVESIPGLKDFSPMEMKYGEYYAFNGNKCTHGNKINQTNQTRVSFDFRIMPYNRYLENKKESMSATKGKKFVIGDYYKLG